MMLDAWSRSLPAAADRLIRGGYLAVGTFFVLSGFVLARGYAATAWNRANLLRYGAARFARIYPVYALSLLLVSPFIVSERLPLLPQKAGLVLNYTFLLQGWTGTLPVNWNTPAWSLSCELFFYLCFPLALVLARHTRWSSILALAALTPFMPELLVRAGVPDFWKPMIHMADFLAGIAAAGAFGRLERRRLHGAWLYVPAVLASVCLIAAPQHLPFGLSLNSALRPLNALLLIGLALSGGVPARALSARAVVFFGKASYSMYILHIPVMWWYKRFVPVLFHTPPKTVLGFLFIAVVLIVSSLVFHYVEEPANQWLRRCLSPARTV